MAKTIELDVEIDAQGQVKVHVKGAPGEACLDYLKTLSKVLGPVVTQTLTPEYYQTQIGVTKQTTLVKKRGA